MFNKNIPETNDAIHAIDNMQSYSLGTQQQMRY